MGYIIAIVLLVVVVPLLFVMLSRRTTSAGGVATKQPGRGMTVSQPSSDQPSPRGGAVNPSSRETERRLPPG